MAPFFIYRDLEAFKARLICYFFGCIFYNENEIIFGQSQIIAGLHSGGNTLV